MFPPTKVRKPEASSISPISEVVVVLPFEPVMPRMGWARNQLANSTSGITRMRRSRALTSSGMSQGTPGLATTKSCTRNVASRWAPSSMPTLRGISSEISDLKFDGGFESVTVTTAPRLARLAAAARPLRARPTTSTRLPARSITPPSLSALRRRQDRAWRAARSCASTHSGFPRPPRKASAARAALRAERSPASAGRASS